MEPETTEDHRQRVLFDTSALLPALVEKHPHFPRTAPKLQLAHDGEIQLVVSTHAIAELFSTLTSLPLSPRVRPEEASRLIEQNVRTPAEVITLTEDDYEAAVMRLVRKNLSGGAIYDGLHVQAAIKAKVDRLWTINLRDFIRIWPDHGGVIEGL